MHAHPSTPEAGEILGSYALRRLVGEGSMGQVYEARHLKLDRVVAIKLLRTEQAQDAELVQRFFQEARAVNRVDHPHIVQIHDFVEDVGPDGARRAWCVMEYVPGVTLAELLLTHPLPLERVLRIMDQVCAALQAAHEVGVIHRDLKPENVLITRGEEGRDVAKVLDFGVAKLLRPDPEVPLRKTWEGAIVGTPRYMSPEQAASLEVDARADIYGAGCLLYELVTGRPPFDGESFGPLMARILTHAPDPLPERTAADEPLPEALCALILRCLEKDPAARPQSMAGLREELAHARALASRGSRSFRPGSAALPFAAALLAALAFAVRGVGSEADALQLSDVEASAAAVYGAPPAEVVSPRGEQVGLPPMNTRIASPEPVGASAAAADTRKASLQSRRPAHALSKGPGAVPRSSRDAVLNPFGP